MATVRYSVASGDGTYCMLLLNNKLLLLVWPRLRIDRTFGDGLLWGKKGGEDAEKEEKGRAAQMVVEEEAPVAGTKGQLLSLQMCALDFVQQQQQLIAVRMAYEVLFWVLLVNGLAMGHWLTKTAYNLQNLQIFGATPVVCSAAEEYLKND
jgi:hypothetical protein